MNTQNATTPTVTDFLDADYHAVIAEHIAMYPMAIAMVVEPNLMGRYDAETGMPCDPIARGYMTLADCEQYVIGWSDTAAFWEAQAEEYDDWMAEQDWIRRGC